MLGTAVGDEGKNGADLICDGSRGNGKGQPPAGICVYYGQESDWQTIRWLVKLKTALNTVDALNNQTATIQRCIEKLQMLLHRAEKIYETKKVITEVQHPVGLTALHNPTTKRLTAYSASRRHDTHAHFHSLWLLL
ncbi:hypothetical protein, unlikely [Trypanosoma congolense IL3000]|uniref:Variant surface glycoprotein n=1 Tax=Trypanosoma congolense (strain IL3000) TaxID=1068625 RepID=F9WD91_TRYCI|nr:hypothetical protein, unlikely [Trypanosoma congolense IL3000]